MEVGYTEILGEQSIWAVHSVEFADDCYRRWMKGKMILKLTLFYLSALITTCCLGCDRQSSSSALAADQSAKSLDRISNEIHELGDHERDRLKKKLDEGEGDQPPSPALVDAIAAKIDEGAGYLDGADADRAREIAEALRDVRDLMEPHGRIIQEFLFVGGFEPSTIDGVDDIDRRIAMLVELGRLNDKIDQTFPSLHQIIEPEPDENGKLQLQLLSELRQAERTFFSHGHDAFDILRAHWDALSVSNEGEIVFDGHVPDAEVDAYNNHTILMGEAADETLRLQRLYAETL